MRVSYVLMFVVDVIAEQDESVMLQMKKATEHNKALRASDPAPPAVQLQYHVNAALDKPGFGLSSPGLCLSLGKSHEGTAGCDGGGCSGSGNSDATLQPCNAADEFQSFTYRDSDKLLRSESGDKDQCVRLSVVGNPYQCEPFTLEDCDATDAWQQFTKESVGGGSTVWRNNETARAIDVSHWKNIKDNWVWACGGTNGAKYFDTIVKPITSTTTTTPTTGTTTTEIGPLDAAAGLVAKDSKCHFGSGSSERLFRLTGQASLEECQARCLETPRCKFYSWAGGGRFAQVCMGCHDAQMASKHQGFSLHALHRADLDRVSPVA